MTYNKLHTKCMIRYILAHIYILKLRLRTYLSSTFFSCSFVIPSCHASLPTLSPTNHRSVSLLVRDKLGFPRILCKWAYLVCSLFWPGFFLINTLRFIHIVTVATVHSFYFWVVFHYMGIPQFVDPFTTDGLLCYFQILAITNKTAMNIIPGNIFSSDIHFV